ncbi:hypothetical protein ACFWIB_42395 [Streptomyces sp. NPDC127051]
MEDHSVHVAAAGRHRHPQRRADQGGVVPPAMAQPRQRRENK